MTKVRNSRRSSFTKTAEPEVVAQQILRHLYESVFSGVRPFRADKDDPLLFAKAWSDAASAIGFAEGDANAILVVRSAFWNRSLNASIELVELVLPSWTWTLERDNDVDDAPPYWCELRSPTSQFSMPDEGIVRASGISPVHAVLRALMSERIAVIGMGDRT